MLSISWQKAEGEESGRGTRLAFITPPSVMTQPVGKARVHLSVERDGGGVNARH